MTIAFTILTFILFIFSLYKDGYILKNKKKEKNQKFSFRKYAWLQFKKNKIALISLYFLGIMIVVALLASYIANDKPLYAVYKGESIFPAFTKSGKYTINENTNEEEIIEFNNMKKFEWKELDYDYVVWAPITFSPGSFDEYNVDYKSPSDEQKYKNSKGEIINAPLRFRHFLGTDKLGRDLASGLVHGTKISLTVGLVSMGIASIFGIILGAFAGYFGDRRLKMRRIKYYFTLLGIFLGIFYAWRKYEILDAFNKSSIEGYIQLSISILILIGTIIFLRFISRFIRLEFFNQEINVPIDTFISRGIELLNSIPRLLLIITVAAVQKEPKLMTVMVIIGLTSWTGIARFTRAELLRIRNLEYISASTALGFSSIRIIFKHALPNALAPVFVSIAFGIASAILIESGLSFLGIGVPPDIVTWGSLLNSGREYHEAWWLIIYPGVAIFFTITIYNMIAEAARDALDPKLKS